MVRPARHLPWLVVLPLSLALPATGRALAPPGELAFRAHVENLVESGELAYDQGLLFRFQRVFAPGDLPADLASPHAWPAKSATSLILEFEGMREAVASPIVGTIEGYLRTVGSVSARVHETLHFRLTYETEGAHAVSSADLDGNGVPDFVERVGEYAETSWRMLVEVAGFTAPTLPNGRYELSFREMHTYGYTVRAEGGTTAIVLHRDFEGFPPNSDPDGPERGAAKVSIAHEFKHASQFAASGWTEGGWLEADATWAEDFVFDETNDYLRYLSSGSPVSDPEGWLRAGQASYEDCLWQHLLQETYGEASLVEFFVRRARHPTESVVRSFDHVLRSRGASLKESVRTLGLWSYFAGANAYGRPIGFEEASSFPTPPIENGLSHPSETLARELSGMGTQFVLVGGSERVGNPSVSFVGDEAGSYSVHAIVTDRHGVREVAQIPLTSSKVASHEVPADWENLAILVIAVSNLGEAGSSSGYFLSVDDHHAVGVDPFLSTAFSLAPNRPNPFRASTSIGFTLPTDDSVRLSIFDVGGRLVRRLVEGHRLDAGEHVRVWNGVDESGRLSAPGVYYYRLESGDRSATRQMLLLR